MPNKITILIALLIAGPVMGDDHDKAAPLSIDDIIASIPPNRDVIAKTCDIPISSITKYVINMVPFRGVNIIFPFKLDDSVTAYYMSSNKIWKYEKAGGTKIVGLSYSSFDNKKWGAVNDFSIVIGDYLFAFTLKATPIDHCVNLRLTFSKEEKLRFENAEKKTYLDNIKREYDKKYNNLDKLVNKKSLALVGKLARSGSTKTLVREENKLKLANGDALIFYVDYIKNYGDFSVVMFELENETTLTPVYIEDIQLFNISAEGNPALIPGVSNFIDKIKAGATQEMTYTTLAAFPDKSLALIITTSKGEVAVKW